MADKKADILGPANHLLKEYTEIGHTSTYKKKEKKSSYYLQ